MPPVAYRLPLLCSAFFLTADAILAASFDCKLARTQVEIAICADPQLSQMDESLAKRYRQALKLAAPYDDTLKTSQRNWLRSTRSECEVAEQPAACVKTRYEWRIEEIDALPLPAKDFDATDVQRIENASQRLDFWLSQKGTCDEYACEGPGQVAVMRKGEKTPLQTIAMPNIFMSQTQQNQPLVNSAQLHAYQGVINVGDFNFDGHEDFAVQNGNHGSYGGPSYDVFLYDPKQQAFAQSHAMTALIQETLGFFGVDEKLKRLSTFGKSGCCYHESHEYEVHDNQLILVKEFIEDAMNPERPDLVYLTTRELIDGKWKTSERTEPVKSYYGEQ